MALEHAPERVVEAARAIAFGRADELVVEAEAVQERLQAPVHVRAVTLCRAERIRNRGQGLMEMLRDLFAVRDVVRHGAQPVHVVGEGIEFRWPARQELEHLAHERGPEDLGEGADMRQAGRPVAGLEQNEAFRGRPPAEPLDQPDRLDHRPSLACAQQFQILSHHSPLPSADHPGNGGGPRDP